MGTLMGERAVIGCRVPEGLERGHLDVIGHQAVVSPIAAMPDLCLCVGEKPLGMLDARHGIQNGFRRGVEMRRQAFDLRIPTMSPGYSEIMSLAVPT